MPITFTADNLMAATKPTFYFVGVSTAKSSIRQIFPLWAEELSLGDVDFVGIDLPLHAPAGDYRRVVEFLKTDPLSLGALVTTHKLDLYHAAHDLFDYSDPLAGLMDEVSCISKRGPRLRAHAKDPITAGLAIDEMLPEEQWSRRDRTVFLMGAGGSAIAMTWHLTRAGRGDRVPREIVVSNPTAPRLHALRDIYRTYDTDVPLRTVVIDQDEGNDQLLATMPPGTFVVNATGLGKDAPGSPLSDAAVFPPKAVAWDLNYRGDLTFLDQAHATAAQAGIRVIDGWHYFIHGWTSVIAEVFDREIPPSGAVLERLASIAAATRTAGAR